MICGAQDQFAVAPVLHQTLWSRSGAQTGQLKYIMKTLIFVTVLLLTGCATYDPYVNEGINRGLLNAIKHIK